MLIPDISGFLYHAWLASALLPPDITQKCMNEFQTPERVFQSIIIQKNKPDFIPPAGLNTLIRNSSEDLLLHLNEMLMQHQIKAITINDSYYYPSSLSQIENPPAILFYQGNIQCLKNRMLAMVGSRVASYDGEKAARKIARELSREGVSIISGMAGGIDSASHTGCIEGGTPTIAVTGCGLDIVYPAGNVKLRDEILKSNGLLLSEYAPGEKPVGWHFPFRNRIITGIGYALIVIEAKIRSGTMTSVQHALNQGKDVFVYPGNPASQYCEGNHQLLREGALYFTTSADILEDLRWLDNREIIGQNSVCSDKTEPTLTPDEETVFSILKPGRLSFEQIADKSKLSPAALMSTLTMLQIKGSIEALPGKQYQLKESNFQSDSEASNNGHHKTETDYR